MRYCIPPNTKRKFLLSIVAYVIIQTPMAAQVIPYPDPLKKAAIIQTSIDDLDSEAMIIGNGDINALIYSRGNDLVMHLAKNDVWDARLVTEEDPPLLSVNVKEHSWMGGGRPASWNHPYPTQTPPAIVIIESSGEVKKATIDIQSGLASIKTNLGESTIRALSQSNVYYIETDRKISMEGFSQSFLPSA